MRDVAARQYHWQIAYRLESDGTWAEQTGELAGGRRDLGREGDHNGGGPIPPLNRA